MNQHLIKTNKIAILVVSLVIQSLLFYNITPLNDNINVFKLNIQLSQKLTKNNFFSNVCIILMSI